MSNPAAMSNPTGPDNRRDADQGTARTDGAVEADASAATEIFEPADPATDPTIPVRRFTAPSSFDGKTQILAPLADPETEMMPPASPQEIPGTAKTAKDRRSWGWVIALVLVIAAIAAVAVLGTVLLTRGHSAMNAEWPATTQNFAISVS
ncbi:hypothetical protein [Mycolicibacterium sp. CBMA 234]|uniref:hypothetical protein n=1 Tax=Mycolicibacterium sp. CBMA 234 TaxID=1918495 RepID=UPI0012DC36F2|nr:hypothetical protein [Mycolicibacterium sp. CBMA 234]